jgi:uncharacterized protein YidB (DUF937 family)
VGAVIVRAGKVRLVGRDDRHIAGIGEIKQARLDGGLRGQTVTLQFDIEPVAKCGLEGLQSRLREIALSGGKGEIDRAARAAGQRDQARAWP